MYGSMYYAIISILLVIAYYLLFFNKRTNILKFKIYIRTIVFITVLLLYTLLLHLDYKMFRFKTIENAFNYQSDGSKILFKKEEGNNAYVIGGVHSNDWVQGYYYYSKDDKGWRITQTRFNINKYRLCLFDNNVHLEAYIMSNAKKNIHGIFIIPLEKQEQEVNEFYDSKGDIFNIVNYKKLKLANKKVRKPVFFGIVKGELNKDYYVQIYKEKYYLGKYKKGCVG